ncbi:MAG: hypothetical protein KAI17_23450, partial [Thiotrichaceae bacterium]|nr:hypothetical protein [Thiotrichaceae bacterium]
MKKCVFDLSLNDDKVGEAHFLGDWVIGNTLPTVNAAKQTLQKQGCVQLNLHGKQLGKWDSRLVLFLFELEAFCKAQNIVLDLADLPVAAQGLLKQASAFPVRESGQKASQDVTFIAQLGLQAQVLFTQTLVMLTFVGE